MDDDQLELKCPQCREWHMRTEAEAEEGQLVWAAAPCADCLDQEGDL